MELMLTKHFEQRWMERVGNWPTPQAVTEVIRNSVKIQHGENLRRRDGTPFRMLAIYWSPELAVVIKVDVERSAAVTVLTPQNSHVRPCDVTLRGREPDEKALSERAQRVRASFCPQRRQI